MRTPEYQRIDFHVMHCPQIIAGNQVGRFLFDIPLFRQRYEQGTGEGEDLQFGIQVMDHSRVCIRPDRRIGADHADAPVFRLLDSGLSARLDHADHRYLDRLADLVKRHRRSRIAGAHNELHLMFPQKGDVLTRKLDDNLFGPPAIGSPPDITEIDDVFKGDHLEELAGDGQTADTGIEDPNRRTLGRGVVGCHRFPLIGLIFGFESLDSTINPIGDRLLIAVRFQQLLVILVRNEA